MALDGDECTTPKIVAPLLQYLDDVFAYVCGADVIESNASATAIQFMIADAVRYTSVHGWKQPDSHGLSRTPQDPKQRPANPEKPQATGRFRRWWQVQDSNLGRRSRRFYREPIATPRNGR